MKFSQVAWWRRGAHLNICAPGTWSLLPLTPLLFPSDSSEVKGEVALGREYGEVSSSPSVIYGNFPLETLTFEFFQNYFCVVTNCERTEWNYPSQRSAYCIFWDCFLLTTTTVSALVPAVPVSHQDYWASHSLVPVPPRTHPLHSSQSGSPKTSFFLLLPRSQIAKSSAKTFNA